MKPTIDEAKAYAAEIGMAVDDAENFHDHFESNGWKVGGRSPMKDWKAAMRKWNRNTPNFKKPAAHNPTTRRAEKASREYHEEPIPIPNLEDDD